MSLRSHLMAAPPYAQRGFSLIELLVVIVIIGLLSTVAVLSMADPRGRISGDADRFAGRVRAARDAAIISGRPVALWVSATGYGFEKRQSGQWEPVSDGPLASASWSGGTNAAFSGVSQLRAVFDSIGRADRALEFRLSRDERGLRVRMDFDGKVTSGD
jgi:general secretion pathway protein H